MNMEEGGDNEILCLHFVLFFPRLLQICDLFRLTI